MNDAQSILVGLSVLGALLVVAIVLTVARPLRALDPDQSEGLLRLFLIGVAVQCFHVIEELVTGFHVRWPELLGQTAWSAEFFVALNVSWIAIWLLSAVGLRLGGTRARVSLAPTWFFAIAMTLNGIAHPGLCLLVGGYFPGLVTSPVVGVLGVFLVRRLARATGGS